jgi:hypothetical protein
MGGMNLAAFTAPFQYARPVQQPSPWEAAAQYGQLRAMAQMAQLRQAEVQNQQLQAQQVQQALAADQAARQLFASNPNPTTQQILSTVGPKAGIPLDKDLRDMRKAQLDFQDAQLGHAQKIAQYVGQQFGGVNDEASYQNAVTKLQAAGMPVDQMPANYDATAVDALRQKGLTLEQQITQHREDLKAKREQQLFEEGQLPEARAKAVTAGLETAARTVPDNQADWDTWRGGLSDAVKATVPAMYSPAAADMVKLRGVTTAQQPEYNIKSEQAAALAALRAHPESLNVMVGSVIDPKQPEFSMARNQAQNVLNSGGTLKDVNDVIDKYAGVIRQRVSGVIEAGAKIPGEVNKAVAVEKAKAALSPDPFSDITDPSARNRAEMGWNQATKDAQTKIATAQQLRDTIDAYTHGNKTAAALIPIETLRTYLNRLNRTELESLSGAGSLLDKLQGKLGGLTEGKPIPPDIIQGFDQLAQMQENAARRTYTQEVGRIRTGSGGKKIQEMDIPQYQSPAVRALPQGGGKTIDEATARQYKSAYGGDAAKSRQAAIAAGWKIPQ